MRWRILPPTQVNVETDNFSLGVYTASNIYFISNIPPRSKTRPRSQPPPPPPPNLELSAHYSIEHDVQNFRSSHAYCKQHQSILLKQVVSHLYVSKYTGSMVQ